MTVKLALPSGDGRQAASTLLESAGIEAPGYQRGTRQVRSAVEGKGLVVRAFRERDIPIQVASGNYDLGICGDIWTTELQLRFPQQHVVRMGSLDASPGEVWLCVAPESGMGQGELPSSKLGNARIVSEFPNLTDAYATHARLPEYRLLGLWGNAHAYPPEDADLAVVPAANDESIEAMGLVPLHCLFRGTLALIANADALRNRDLEPFLSGLARLLRGPEPALSLPSREGQGDFQRVERDYSAVRLALPDGHAQPHTEAALKEAGLEFAGYRPEPGSRLCSSIAGLQVKVIRPQDMPQMVALGMFDMAVTGRDRLAEHLALFPGSPVRMAVDLGRSRYRIGPVVEEGSVASTTAEAVEAWAALDRPLRIASEYPALAEAFAREHRLHYTQIIPINGASEGFVPEDADVLIEGTETGTSLRANRLKMLDPIMESTNCLIVRREPVTINRALLDQITARLAASVGATVG